MRSQVDVLVVGAGPAGSAAALSINRHHPDLTVAVADKAAFPRDKSCGDALGPGVYGVLRQLGAEGVVTGSCSIDSMLVRGPGVAELRAEGDVDGKRFRGCVLPRVELDARLRSLWVDTGAIDLTGWRLVGASRVDGGVRARLRAGERTAEMGARLLVGADGAYSAVRRAFFAAHPRRHTHVAIRGYVHAPRLDRALRLDFFRELLPAYGWLFPVGDDRANIGIGLPALRAREGRNPRELLRSYHTRLNAEGLVGAQPQSTRAHHLPHAGTLPRFTAGAVALVGDAAAMINPITGEGIFYGMAAGAMLGARLRLNSPRERQASLAEFERAFRRRFEAHYRASYRLHTALRSRWFAEAGLRAAARDEQLVALLASMIFDEGRLTPSVAWRALARAARRRAARWTG